MGESGSGKTTLLNVISTLDKQTNGKVVLNGKNISTLKESKLQSSEGKSWDLYFKILLIGYFLKQRQYILPMVLSDYKPKK